MGVFSRKQGPANNVKRNSFDLSFRNHLTTKFGQLTPVFCKEVLPGDSFRIDTRFGLQFMPTYFPVQTPMRADIHFFYVRNRNLWKDWPDFIGKTGKNLVSPYVTNAGVFGTGRLSDYLGLPTTFLDFGAMADLTQVITKASSGTWLIPSRFVSVKGNVSSIEGLTFVTGSASNQYPVSPMSTSFYAFTLEGECDYKTPFRISFPVVLNAGFDKSEGSSYNGQQSIVECAFFNSLVAGDKSRVSDWYPVPLNDSGQVQHFTFDTPINSSLSDYLVFRIYNPNSSILTPRWGVALPQTPVIKYSFKPESQTGVPYDIGDGDNLSDYSPFPYDLPVSALPFRAYEQIYNAFYRDDRNNPRLVNGEPVYNDYLPTKEGGADPNLYELRFRNWEQDFLTTAVPTPQMGDAPLVGISSTGVATFADPDSGREYTVKATTADDADTIVGFDVKENLPTSVMRSIVNVATSGISINDFRNVNAFQRWKETNIRRGFKYKDQIKAHFDVDVQYAELDMPEFIGGVSERVQVTKVDQTSAGTDSDPLGSFAGQAYAVGKSSNSVSHFCDEHGFIIGILSVVPIPIYTQLMPKFFLKSDPFDYFFPEFGHIGLQPIMNYEVAPMQAHEDEKLEEVFGYQRAWYDYLSSVDEAHGDFRMSLRDFLLGRYFTSTPSLGRDFTIINPNQLNNIFSYTADTDKILGEIIFNVQAKRPIPRFGIPRLEASV